MTAAPTAEQIRERLGARGNSARCPAHEDTEPSLSISDGPNGKPLLKCHRGCSQTAVIEALQARGIWPKASGLTVAELADTKHLPETLLRESGFADDDWKGQPAVRIQYRDSAGHIICTRYRGGGDDGPRFWFRKGDKQQLYGLWRLQADHDVIVVEGETDSLALWDADFNVIGVPGAEAWKDDRFAATLEQCPVIYVHIEPDAGGEKFRAAFERSRLRDRVRFFTVPGAKDPCELYSRDPEGFRVLIEAALTNAQPIGQAHRAEVVRAAIGAAAVPLSEAEAMDVVNGAALLADVQAFIKRFCSFPDEHALVAVTLWVLHAHTVEHFHTSPRLALLSPEPGSGKTRVLEVLHLLVPPQSMFSLSPSPATIFRTLSKGLVTLLIDECDTIFTHRGKDDTNEDLRSLLNSGYKRGATIPRCVGPKHDVQNFSVYCATALAGLGDLPDTIMTRSVVIRMRRRAPSEHIEPFRSRVHEPEGHKLREHIARWATQAGQRAGESWPMLPDGIVDRPAEVWEPLLAIADAAAGAWPERAREACVSMYKASQDNRVSLGVRLLSDLRIIFAKAGNPEALRTETILTRLCGGRDSGLEDDAPWNELHGKPLGVRGLASMLKRYAVKPAKVKVDGGSFQGYRREHLWDAWTRYLSPLSAQAEPPEPMELLGGNSRFQVPQVPEGPQKVPDGSRALASPQVCDKAEEICPNGSEVPQVPQVPDMRGVSGAEDDRSDVEAF